MSKRVTIMIPDDIYKKLKLEQSKVIATAKTCSFSGIIEIQLRKVFK